MLNKKHTTSLFNPCTIIIFFCTMVTTSTLLAHDEAEHRETRTRSGQLFSALLPDVPGKRLTVVELNYKPKKDSTRTGGAHRHPGSVYVYVTRGSVRWGIEGQPVKILHTGESFFEPAGVLHTVSENASDTEPASVIAVMVLPDGAPLVLPE